ncbi:MAG: alkaline phosphatase family protein [Thermoguttaceae bacterium]
MKKVVIVGFDGLDPPIVDRMLEAGELPAFGRLRAAGAQRRLATTYPAETPVAFATFATGTNPGGHGIFDFVRRNPATYLPDQAFSRYEQKSRFLPPRVVNLRRGVPVWQLLTEAGVPSVVLRAPCTYGPAKVEGRMLSGLGVPDLRGGQGTPTFYTAEPEVRPGHDEQVVVVRPDPQGSVQTYVIGPRHPATRRDCHAEIQLRIDPAGRQVAVHSAGEPPVVTVAAGRWSEWLRLKFKIGLLQAVRGMVRFYLVRTEPRLELYASAVHFDPDSPPYPISAPPEYARELAGRLGAFATAGMVEEHTGLNNGRIGEDAFLDQCQDLWLERERMLLGELERLHSGLLFCLFDTPDRIQHMFWRCGEPDHPASRGAPCQQWSGAIEDAYRRCDAIVGRLLERIDGETLLLVMSDHGFGSFRRAVDLNAWLRQEGLLALKEGLEPGEAAHDMLRGIDWGRSRAYSVGLSGIFLNRKGREGQGIVAAEEAPRLEQQIAAALPRLRDPADGAAAVRSVLRRDEIYAGPYAAESPDLVVNCAAGYRLSWRSGRGGVARECIEDNDRKWSGDHIVDPALVPGILFSNRPLRGAQADLRDLAPTILGALGVAPGAAMEGKSLVDEDFCGRT